VLTLCRSLRNGAMKKRLTTAAVVAAVTALANVARAAQDTDVSQSIALLQDCEFAGDEVVPI
jgi:hypothetical protein